MARLYESLLLPTLENQVRENAAVHDAQFGFTKASSAVQQTAHLATLPREADAFQLKMLVAFVDLEKAYDTVCRNTIVNKMLKSNFTSDIVNIICNVIQQRQFVCVKGKHRSTIFRASDGLPQGGPLSHSYSTSWWETYLP